MLCNLAVLKAEEYTEIRSLEENLGKPLLAFRCFLDVKLAELTDAELGRIRDLEDKLGLSLVAVEQQT